ncbi:MAG: AraC family ligand binding domain-containing protein [Desulfobacter sp.]|nr:MAG: AraC family ligand binding domain-containing protein [Desulfobacter sp.]
MNQFLSTQYTDHEFASHTHDSFAIGIVESGAQSFRYKSPPDIVPAGNIMVIHPGKLHTGYCIADKGCSYQMIYTDPNVALKIFSDFIQNSIKVFILTIKILQIMIYHIPYARHSGLFQIICHP